jgi:cation diffusion facilitator family transporter
MRHNGIRDEDRALKPDALARRVALASILISAILAVVKIAVGLKANSTAVVSDGMESAGDVLGSGLVLFGLILAAKPPDEDHPYGHGRVETLSALGVGVLLAATGSLICFRSIERAFEVQQAPQAFAVWPLLGSIVVKSVSWSAKWHYGRRARSDALAADAWNDAVDILSGATALVALGLALWNPTRFVAADHIGGVAVGCIVIFLGAKVVRDTALQLMDTMPAEDAMRQIREVALSVPGTLGIEKCFARKTGLQYHVDLHLEVDPLLSVQASHEIATQVRIRIKEELDWVADVLVHVEPFLAGTISSRHGES